MFERSALSMPSAPEKLLRKMRNAQLTTRLSPDITWLQPPLNAAGTSSLFQGLQSSLGGIVGKHSHF